MMSALPLIWHQLALASCEL